MSYLFGMTSQNRGFSRNSVATYYNSAGLRKIAAINVPRIQYNPTTLALEGAFFERNGATNLLLFSNAVATPTWVKGSGTTITQNSTVGASGLIDMSKVDQTTQSSSVLQLISVTNGGTYTVSADLKKGVGDWVYFLLYDNGNGNANQLQCWYNFTTNSIGTNQAVGQFTLNSFSVRTLPNGIVRLTTSGILTQSTAVNFRVKLVDMNGSALGITGSFYMGCAQMELGGTETSYIPSTSTAATRAPEVGG
ncbi:hypothetical protein [Dyadobacter sp. CY312]|uniref:phage head spike fiber domain-containing protein n=1 Tax=Dyadobacter sp. CY312 TaxID=2907303 RepID=UPI001F3C9082|nr:hypothetical protein [Dyadobacter sp. CY312]MCE7039259.1 hypothetical protein [Dyadobacter sp. CY312]